MPRNPSAQDRHNHSEPPRSLLWGIQHKAKRVIGFPWHPVTLAITTFLRLLSAGLALGHVYWVEMHRRPTESRLHIYLAIAGTIWLVQFFAELVLLLLRRWNWPFACVIIEVAMLAAFSIPLLVLLTKLHIQRAPGKSWLFRTEDGDWVSKTSDVTSDGAHRGIVFVVYSSVSIANAIWATVRCGSLLPYGGMAQ
jgi:hypothetical protein